MKRISTLLFILLIPLLASSPTNVDRLVKALDSIYPRQDGDCELTGRAETGDQHYRPSRSARRFLLIIAFFARKLGEINLLGAALS